MTLPADRPVFPFESPDAMIDAIKAWERRPADSEPCELHTWLGMSAAHYAAFESGRAPDITPDMIAARRLEKKGRHHEAVRVRRLARWNSIADEEAALERRADRDEVYQRPEELYLCPLCGWAPDAGHDPRSRLCTITRDALWRPRGPLPSHARVGAIAISYRNIMALAGKGDP